MNVRYVRKKKSEITYPARLLQPFPIPDQKMGRYIDGFHHRFAQIFGKGLHICGSGYIE